MLAVRGVATSRPAARAPSASAAARPRVAAPAARARAARRPPTSPVASFAARRLASGRASRRVAVRASGDEEKRSPFDKPKPKRIASPRFSEEAQTWALLGGVATMLTILVTLGVAANDEAAYFGGAWEGDFGYMGDDFTGNTGVEGLAGFIGDVSAGSVIASAVWSFGLFFKSPLQILLVSWAARTPSGRATGSCARSARRRASPTRGASWRTRTSRQRRSSRARAAYARSRRPRPRRRRRRCSSSPRAVRRRGRVRLGVRRRGHVGLSAGIGFTMLSFVAELGSPRRFSKAELDIPETQYADFLTFAEESLERRGGATARR